MHAHRAVLGAVVVAAVASLASAGVAAGAGAGPQVTVKVTSQHAKSQYGWYRTPITLTYTCTATSADVSSCPAPVTITSSGKDQHVTRTATDADGNQTTVTSGPFNLDRVKPTVNVKRLKGNRVACTSFDGMSGIATLQCVHHHVKSGTRWTGIATDKAGNSKRKSIVVSGT